MQYREKLGGDFTYYLDKLDMPFTFIGVCETWATPLNEDVLNIDMNINMNTILDQIKGEEGCKYLYSEYDTI